MLAVHPTRGSVGVHGHRCAHCFTPSLSSRIPTVSRGWQHGPRLAQLIGGACSQLAGRDFKAAATDSTELSLASAPDSGYERPALVWFKNDLRVDDHPGVAAAAKAAGGAVFVYCFDEEVLAPLIFFPGAVAVLVWAVEQLQRQLGASGSSLIVRVGRWSEVIPRLAAEVNAEVVLAEQEVCSSSQAVVDTVQRQLAQQGISLKTWDLPAWDKSTLTPDFRQWKRSRGPPHIAADPVPQLPPAPDNLHRGHIPTVEELQAMLGQAGLQESNKKLQEAAEKVAAAAQEEVASHEARLLQRVGMDSLQLLELYLRQQGSNGSLAAAQAVVEATERTESPAAEGGSFTALFGLQLRFGTISRRRVLQRAAQARDGNKRAGRPARPSTPWVAAIYAAERSEFHHQLLSCQDTVKASMPQRSLKPKTWRWRSLLADYCEGHPPGGPHPESPAVLLLHGFGAFGAHWRFNVEPLVAEGYHVYAPTLPGFGRTEKASLPYSQELWSSYLRDFVLHKVRKPVVLAGNSIGGFIAASFAAEYPHLVSGLVLVNSAGPIDAGFSPSKWAQSARSPPPAWLAFSISAALFWYLEKSVKGTLRWLYPRNPQNADDWLMEEILRAAADSGSLGVFKSVFYLPPPRALNYLVKDLYGGPTLVLQGALDPLNDAKARAAELVQLCPNASKKLIDAGHCPHDELPEAFNAAMLEFLHELGARALSADDTPQPSVPVLLESKRG